MDGVTKLEEFRNGWTISVGPGMPVIKGVQDMASSFLESLLLRETFDEFSGFPDHVPAIWFSGSFDALLCLRSHGSFRRKVSMGLQRVKKNQKG